MIADSLERVTHVECRAALEDIAHLTRKVCLMWGTPELDTFLSRLIMDARDGDRQGLPIKVAAEVLFLAQTNKMIRATDLAKKLNVRVEEAYRLVDEGDQARLQTDAFDDPLVSRDTVTRGNRSTAPMARRSTAPGVGSQAQGLGELLMMLVRSKWLAWSIALVLGAKFVWPTVKALI
jgi:hypothetical protein